MNQKIIIFFIDKLGDITAGTEKHLTRLIEKLLNYNEYKIYLFTIYKDNNIDELFKGNFEYIWLLEDGYKYNLLNLAVQTYSIFNKVNPDLVNTYFLDPYIATGYTKYLIKYKWIHHLRNMGYLENIKFRILDLPARPHVDHYIVNSFAVNNYLQSRYHVKSDKISVIYNSIPEKYFQFKQPVPISRSDFVIGLVGNVRPVKGIEILLDAAFRCKSDIPNLQVHIVGDDSGEYASQIKILACKLNVDVKFHGRQRDVTQFISKFDIALNTSHSEGFSNAVLEYMALGKPVIISDAGGNSEAIVNGESGLLFVRGNSEDLAEKIVRLYKNRELQISIGAGARKRCEEKYTEGRMMEEYVNALDKILAS